MNKGPIQSLVKGWWLLHFRVMVMHTVQEIFVVWHYHRTPFLAHYVWFWWRHLRLQPSDHLLTTNRLINSENNGQKQPHINNHQKKKKKKPIADTLEILGRYHLAVCLPACGWCALIIISHAQYMCCGRELIAGKSLASILKQTCKRTRRLRRHRLTLKGLPPRLAVPRRITARLTFPWHKKIYT